MSGVNFRNKDYLRLATVQGYTASINSLFRLRGMKALVDTSDPNNMVGILINNLVKEEDIARQHSPLDSNIFAALLRKLNISCLPDSEQRTLFNLFALGYYIGPRVSIYAQTTNKNMDYHVYPSGKQVIKVFTANDFQFFDKNGDEGLRWPPFDILHATTNQKQAGVMEGGWDRPCGLARTLRERDGNDEPLAEGEDNNDDKYDKDGDIPNNDNKNAIGLMVMTSPSMRATASMKL
jgi:hypothetical protein